ncbi:MAG: flagellar export protein FliJ [Calditrichaeota bacterium]|nr:flagellar export protein FliJ [Calditrichota bacterium]
MKRFRFRLQKVLDVRRIRERQEQEKLQQAIRRRMQEEKRLDVLEKEVKDILQIMRQKQQTPFEAWAYVADARYRGRVEQAKVVQLQRIEEASRLENSRRQDFTAARRQTRVLEKLKEVRHEEWKREASRQEDKMLDEVAAHAHAHAHYSREVVQ